MTQAAYRPAGLAVVFILASAIAAGGEPLRIGLPLKCVPGVDCFVQNYPDVDPTSAAGDHACGQMTYNGHTGTDFRLTGIDQMRRGVAVVAAAAGVVARTRDGVSDNTSLEPPADIPEDRACGNGVVIDHGNGWSTQYCHLQKSSLRVRPKDRVAAGDVLGLVGLSGDTEFPHLHFALRKGDTLLDPFTRLSLETGCGADGAPLWDAATSLSLGYRSAAILNTGFAAGPVTDMDVETGRFAGFRLAEDSPALVFYGRAIGLVAGDVEVVEIRGPDGSVLISHAGEPMDRPRAQHFTFAGRKKPKRGWEKGAYVGIFRVVRSGQIVSEASRTIVYD